METCSQLELQALLRQLEYNMLREFKGHVKAMVLHQELEKSPPQELQYADADGGLLAELFTRHCCPTCVDVVIALALESINCMDPLERTKKQFLESLKKSFQKKLRSPSSSSPVSGEPHPAGLEKPEMQETWEVPKLTFEETEKQG